MSARWHEALDSQARAFAFFDSPRGRLYARDWADSWSPEGGLMHEKRVHAVTGRPLSEAAVDSYRKDMAFLPDVILAGDTIFVESEMLDLAEHAAQTFAPEAMVAEDLPVQRGYMYLARPIFIRDRHEKAIAVRVFAWATAVANEHGPGGMVLYLLHRVGDSDDYSTDEREFTKGSGFVADDLLIVHMFPIPWNYPLQTGEDAGVPAGAARDVIRPLAAIFRLMQQTIGVMSQERPDRHTRRRMPPPLVENLVTVVKLRRPHKDPDPDHEPSTVDWAHRWAVSGHWRQQWYPSLGMHRQIWISPYVKGPDDKPLVLRKARVLNLAR